MPDEITPDEITKLSVVPPQDAEESETGPPAPADIDPSVWLSTDDSVLTDFVGTRHGRMKIAAVDEQEMGKLIELSKGRMDPRTRTRPTDPMLLRRWLICYSINKAQGWMNPPGQILNPKAILPGNAQFMRKLTGELTHIQTAIQKLSGLTDDETAPSSDPQGFLA